MKDRAMTFGLPDHPPYPRRVAGNAVRATLCELLGVRDPAEAPAYALDREEQSDGLCIRRVRFANMLGEEVPGVLMVPAAGSTNGLPAVVCTPGTAHDADLLAEARFHRDMQAQYRPLKGWARELARRGFATLSLTLHMNDPRSGGEKGLEQKAKFLAPYGITMMGLLVDEVLRAARLLAAHEAVDRDRVGLMGFSLGGNASWYAFACAPWIRAAVPVCGGLGSLRRQIAEGDPERHGPYFYVPHLLRYFDHPTIVRTCITPRPLLVVAPTEDQDMPATGVSELIGEVKPAYEGCGASDALTVYQPAGRHEFSVAYFETATRWLGDHL